MNILILGSGGREHALAWKIQQSPLCKSLFVAPGNAGTKQMAQNVALNLENFEEVKEFCIRQNITCLIVGPEDPLVNGIYDFIKAQKETAHILVVGPSAEAAMLEGSKAFAKEFMQRNDIPTAAYRSFTQAEIHEGKAYISKQNPPIVLKADGLAAGKGVLICEDVETALEEFEGMLKGKFGAASNKVVVEEFLQGIEYSMFALTDGKDYLLLPTAKDYKRIGEGDNGLNTGGMGAISHPKFVDDALLEKSIRKVIVPTIQGLHKEGFVYKGFVFFGLINVAGEPYVIEYNCRLGDPETEAILPRIESDLLEAFVAMEEGTLKQSSLKIKDTTAATIILVSGGYPEAYEKGKQIFGLEEVENSIVFHAGTTATSEEAVFSSGGRVLAITALGKNMDEALDIAYNDVRKINFDKMNFRRDIGFDLK